MRTGSSPLAERLAGWARGPLELPSLLDVCSERWWGLPPRLRATLLTLGVGATIALAGLRGLAAPYGPPVEVLVATEALPAGAALPDSASLERQAWPRDLLPDGALTAPEGRLRGPVPAGTPLASVHVHDGGVGGLAGKGRAAVPVPHETLPPVEAGHRLRLVSAQVDGSAARVAEHAEVLAVDEVVWLAVDLAAVDRVVADAARGTLAVAVLP